MEKKLNTISPEFKSGKFYLSFHHKTQENGLPNYQNLIEVLIIFYQGIQDKKTISGKPLKMVELQLVAK